MTAAERILGLLYGRGEAYFALDELGAAAGVGRPALDRAIKALRQRGHELELSPAHGFRLVRPVRLDAHLIERDLGTERVGRSVICFEEVDSTSDVAFQSARQARADGLAVLAEFQRRGRGRRGRRWWSPGGANILLSVLLIDPDELLPDEALTIAAGLAAAEGIADACGLACRLRWPNDVLLDEAKVAGALVEVRRQAGRRCVVVGLGINANAAPPAGEVRRPATSLAEYLGQAVERIEVVRAVLRRLDRWTANIARGRLEGLREGWLARCGMINERITVLCGGRRHVGRALDISPLEGLILCCDDGRRAHLPAKGATVVD